MARRGGPPAQGQRAGSESKTDSEAQARAARLCCVPASSQGVEDRGRARLPRQSCLGGQGRRNVGNRGLRCTPSVCCGGSGPPGPGRRAGRPRERPGDWRGAGQGRREAGRSRKGRDCRQESRVGPASVGAKGEPGTAVWGWRATGGGGSSGHSGGFGSGRGPPWPRGHYPLRCPWQCGLPSRAQSMVQTWLAEAFVGVGSGGIKASVRSRPRAEPKSEPLGATRGLRLGRRMSSDRTPVTANAKNRGQPC